jgi:maltose/moltooligosaccharide transporter
MIKPRLTAGQIWNMCLGLFGVQIVWGLQNGNTSRIFQTLGADVSDLPLLWIAAPATGLLVQPIIGHLSDRTWGPLGRRRPYLLCGAVLTAVSLAAMPSASSIWAASLALWILTASVNVTMEPFRALVADLLPEEQQTTGFAVQVFFIGVGAVLASALPWICAHLLGFEDAGGPGVLPTSVRVAFSLGAAGALGAVLWTIVTTRERPAEPRPAAPSAADAARQTSSAIGRLLRGGFIWMGVGLAGVAISTRAGLDPVFYLSSAAAAMFGVAQLAAGFLRRRGRASLGMLELVEDILHMPPVLRRLAIVQFFTWFGLFALWIYATPAITQRHFGGGAPGSAAYNRGADWVGVLFAGYNAVSAVVALLLPAVAARIGRRVTHALCLACGALGFLGVVLLDTPGLLWAPFIAIGVAWASILSMPYAMLAGALPPRKTGVYMGIHNLFLVLPQLVASMLMGPLVWRLFHGDPFWALGLAAAALAIAALSTLWVQDEGDPVVATALKRSTQKIA